jgi:hypothetical protein
MWCMRLPSVVICQFIQSLDSLVCRISRFPAIVAILLIGLRDLYMYMILP